MDPGKYGFRYDSMKWTLSADDLAGAWVRTILLGNPGPQVVVQQLAGQGPHRDYYQCGG
jgi:hypothetical protein